MGALAHYEEMRVAVERCARIDEAAELRDKAAALEAYARQRDDRDLEVWVSEIRLRASVRIGELVRELDTARPGPTPEDTSQRRDVTSKAQAITDAGLSRSSAHRLEQLAGGRDQRAQASGKAAAETYFAKQRQAREPATMEGLRVAVKAAVHATLGSPPERRAPKPDTGPDVGFAAFYASLRPLAELPFDPQTLADAADLTLIIHLCEVSRDAAKLIAAFLEALLRRDASNPSEAVHG